MMKKTIKMLILDDEPIIRASLSAYFQFFDYEIVEKGSGMEALEAIKQMSDIDIAFVDLGLPDMGGEEFIEKCHKIRNSVQYIVYTGSVEGIYDQHRDIFQNANIEPDQIFLKPISDMDKFKQFIENKFKFNN